MNVKNNFITESWMQPRFATSLSIVCISFLFITWSGSLTAQTTLIKNVSILPMTGPELLSPRHVYISDGQIQKITDLPTGDTVDQEIDGSGLFLMPGLSEMHAHIPVPEDSDDLTYVKETLFLYLANGVTVIRGMLGNPFHLDLKNMVESGDILSPIVYTSSPSMNGNSVPDSETARQKVIAAKEDGYDFLKIHPGIKSQVMSELVSTAQESGIGYSGHIPAEVGIWDAIKYRYGTIDHVDGIIQGLVRDEVKYDINNVGFFGSSLVDHLDWTKMAPIADAMVKNDIWVVPTQTLFTRWMSPKAVEAMMNEPEMKYLPAGIRYSWSQAKASMISNEGYTTSNYRKFMAARKAIIFTLYKHGVKFLLGSDSPQVMNVPGFSIHHEIQSMIDTGMPVYEVLKSGTASPAIFFGQEGEYGTIVEGAVANLILVRENPLENHRTLKSPVGVLVGDRFISNEEIQSALKNIAERHKE